MEESLDLDKPTVRLIQRGLRREGFDPGAATGRFTNGTRAAIKQWQLDGGKPPSGYLTQEQVEELRHAGGFWESQFLGYYMVLPSLVVALALNRGLSGAALLLRRRKDVAYYGLHGLWSILLFALLLQYWHTTALCAQRQVAGSLIEYAGFLLFPASIYFAYTVLMPHDVPARMDGWPRASGRDHYYRCAGTFFTVCSVGMALELVFSEQLQCATQELTGENLMRASGFCTAAALAVADRVAAKVGDRETIHRAGSTYSLVLFLAFAFLFRGLGRSG